MAVTAIEGVIENGKVRLRQPVCLAENTRVYVIVADASEGPLPRARSPRLAKGEQAFDFRKQVVEIPDDAQL